MKEIYYWVGVIMFWANFVLGLVIFLLWFFINIVHENFKYFNKLSQYIIDKKDFKEWQTEKKNKNKIKNWNK